MRTTSFIGTSGESGRFACARCDGLFANAIFHRMTDGKYCDLCLQAWRAEKMVEIATKTTGERFSAMFGIKSNPPTE